MKNRNKRAFLLDKIINAGCFFPCARGTRNRKSIYHGLSICEYVCVVCVGDCLVCVFVCVCEGMYDVFFCLFLFLHISLYYTIHKYTINCQVILTEKCNILCIHDKSTTHMQTIL